MRTELLEGYFIDHRKPNNFDLKKKYQGKRGGVSAECEKTLSHHPTFESAAEAFVRLYQGDKTTGEYKSLVEYIDALKQANAEAVNAVQESKMEHFFMYVPKGNGEKAEHSIVDLIPVGRDNAISRKMLLCLCIQNNIIENSTDADRAMRNLIKKARLDYTILNLSDGHGYYRPSMDDLQDLQKYIRQEENRGKATFKNIALAKRLYEDYKAGRLNE